MTGPQPSESDVAPRPQSSVRRRALVIAAVILIVVSAAWGLWGVFGEQSAPAIGAPQAYAPGVRVSTVTAGPATLTQRLRVTGTVSARDEISIGTAVQDQRIAAVLVDEGDRVVAGQILARLETETLRAQTRQAEAAVARARAAIAQQEAVNVEAQASLQRILPLGRSGAVSEQQVDERRAQAGSAAGGLQVARAELAQAEAQLADVRSQLSRTEIRAPVAGIISERLARIGALASGPDPLFRLIRAGQLELDGEVSELDLAAIDIGRPVRVEVAGVAAPVEGRVRLVAPKVDPQTRLGRVRISLPADADIRAGAFARGTILIGDAAAPVTLPRSAVTTTAQGAASVMAVSADGRAARRVVSLGRNDEETVEITQGLRAGERVVARATAFVRDGDRVQLTQDRAVAPPEAGQ
ncbi:efflux RND transporter periplasmic adaptor subunit [Sphingomonas ursincola]|uniref:Efflux RND transporter periplasmic adaptor subunit n=1 Tax=Sphingomonas ursincola TaxID=56361 RepID=A0A7V8RG97_9SPHN|nr:efflux RND transporter periplasmic adaptor subunit [Sphingomonas ursincola]MBA1375898.1 efflux RND transporter periplasmic adaptor subunit [Sphingomonas ursincola]